MCEDGWIILGVSMSRERETERDKERDRETKRVTCMYIRRDVDKSSQIYTEKEEESERDEER